VCVRGGGVHIACVVIQYSMFQTQYHMRQSNIHFKYKFKHKSCYQCISSRTTNMIMSPTKCQLCSVVFSSETSTLPRREMRMSSMLPRREMRISSMTIPSQSADRDVCLDPYIYTPSRVHTKAVVYCQLRVHSAVTRSRVLIHQYTRRVRDIAMVTPRSYCM
jgi:hypothetical protein